MIYILKKEGEKQIEISLYTENDKWVVEQDDYEYREVSTYTFDTEEQAKLFLDTHVHSFVVDGYELSTQQTLTED